MVYSLFTDTVPQGIFYLYSLLFYLYSLLCPLSVVRCPLSSSCQLELYRDPEVLGNYGIGRRGEEGFVELAVVVCRHGDEL